MPHILVAGKLHDAGLALLDTLSAQRARLAARIDAFADTTASGFTRLRQAAAREAQRLDARLGQVAPDTTAAPRQ